MSKEALISARNIKKSFQSGASTLEILKGVNLDIQPCEDVCIVGTSGAGKSTLLQILGTLDRPSEGELLFQGEELFSMSDEKLSHFRGKNMGFVFQFHHLLPEFSALENIMMAQCVLGASKKVAAEKAQELLKKFGLSERAHHFPSQLSGGEQQRIAIARAIVNEPRVLFADEPTGNLDSANSQIIQNLFFDLKKELGMALVVVTHDRTYASRFSRCLEMADGCF